MGFSAAGFFGKLNENIDNQRDYIRARVDEDRKYLRGEGLKRQAGIQQQRGQYEQAANELIRRGADEKQVLGLLQMDPKGLLQVHATGFTGAALTSSFSIAKDYEGEATMGDILNKIVPSVQAMPEGSSPEKVKRRSLGAFLGLDLDTELENEVYGQQIVGGMTGDDIMSTVGTPISAEGSNPSGVSYDLTRRKDPKALTSAQRNGLFATANSDYTEDMMFEFREGIEDTKPLEGETPEQLVARKEYLENRAGLFTEAKGVDRLAIGVELLGMQKNTKGIFDTYGSTLFNPFNGVNNDLFETLSKASGNSQEASEPEVIDEGGLFISEATDAFTSDPSLKSFTKVVDGKEEVVTREALMPDDNLDDLSLTSTEEALQPQGDSLEAISPVASAFADQLELVADEATWLVTAVSAKLNQQLGEIASAFYKPAGEDLTAKGKKQEESAKRLLEKGVLETLEEFYAAHPDKKPVSKKKKTEAVKTVVTGAIQDARAVGRAGFDTGFKDAVKAYEDKYNIDPSKEPLVPKRSN